MIRKTISGNAVEKSKFWVPEQTKRRSKKKASSTHRKQDENETAAVRRLARQINCNYSHGDLWLTLSWDEASFEKLISTCDNPEDMNEVKAKADHQFELFIKRMRREAKKAGNEFTYIGITTDIDGKTGESVRPHHHVIMRRESYECCMKHWRNGDVDYQLLRNQDDYTPLAVYICRQVRREENDKRWHSSRNLKKPVITEEETHKAGALRPAPGADVKEVGHYDEETGNHYIRYVLPKKTKIGGHKKAAKDIGREHSGVS